MKEAKAPVVLRIDGVARGGTPTGVPPKIAHIQIVYRMFIQNAYMEVLYLTAQISKFIIDLWIKWLYSTFSSSRF